jgi:hypothetical protein
MLESNATTIWESWFFSDNTFSHDHPMFGSVETFMMQALGGIQPHPSAKGFDQVLIKPRPPTGLPHFAAQFGSARGEISVRWSWGSSPSPSGSRPTAPVAHSRNESRALTLTVTIPPNVRADIHVPSSAGTTVRELSAAEGTAADRAADEGFATVVRRGSGVHTFASTVRAQ